MSRWVLSALSTIVVATLASAPPALASQVVFRPLPQVVDPTTRIFTAEVTRVDRARTTTQARWDYGLKDARALRGAVPTARTGRYAEIVPVMLGPDGGVIGHFSPVLDASGEESSVRAGATYIFFAHAAPDGPGDIPVFRVEPMSRLAAVRAVIAALPEAGGALAVSPSPADAASTAAAAPSAAALPSAAAAPSAAAPSGAGAPSAATGSKPAARGCATAADASGVDRAATTAAFGIVIAASAHAARRRRRQIGPTREQRLR